MYYLTGFPKTTLWDGQNRNYYPHFKDGKTKAQRGGMLYSGPGLECSSCQYQVLLPVFPLKTLRETGNIQLPPQCSTLHQLVDNSLIKCWRSLARDQELSYLGKISLQKHFSLFIPPPHWNAKIFTGIGQITSCRLVIFQGKDEKHKIRLGIFNCLVEWKEALSRS